MRTGRKLFLILAVIVLAVVLIYVFSNNNDNTMSIQLYYLNENKTDITPEEREISYDNIDELPERVIKELKKGPENKKLHAFLSKKTEWKIDGNDSMLSVDFTKEFLTTDENYNLLSSYSVVKSLCGIPGITAVKLTVEGAEVILPDNSTIDYLTNKDINLESDSVTTDNFGLKMYFQNSDGKLKSEWRTIPIDETSILAGNVFSGLVKGPENPTLAPVLVSDSQMNSVEVTDGVAYLNVPASFVLKNSGTAEKEINVVYSVVNTLCELDGVTSVQFLIDGKKESGFSNIDLSVLLSPDYSIVAEDK